MTRTTRRANEALPERAADPSASVVTGTDADADADADGEADAEGEIDPSYAYDEGETFDDEKGGDYSWEDAYEQEV